MFAVLLIVIHEHLSCLFIQGTLRKRNDKETLDNLENVIERPSSGIPIFFKSVNANLSFFRDVGMEDLSDEIAYVN